MLRKYTTPLLLIFTAILLGQNEKQPNIQFETEYIDAVNHWVVLPQNSTDEAYLLGYIYLDEIVGFSFSLHNLCEIDNDSRLRLLKKPSYYIIKRVLDHQTPAVHLLNEYEIQELGLPEKPIWLKLMDEREKKAEDLVLMGYHYNKANRSRQAIPFLEQALSMNRSAPNLSFELAFAYNATGAFGKAVTLGYNLLPLEKNNYLLYRELGYALLQLNRIDEAEMLYEEGLRNCQNSMQRREMALDMALTFFDLKNEEKFIKWAEIVRM